MEVQAEEKVSDESPDDFGVDLYNLRFVGEERLPYIGDRLLTANNLVAETGDSDGIHSDTVGIIWTDVRDLLQEFLGSNGDRMLEVAEAVRMCADAYLEKDDENSDMLQSASEGRPAINDFTNGVSGDGMPQSEIPGETADES